MSYTCVQAVEREQRAFVCVAKAAHILSNDRSFTSFWRIVYTKQCRIQKFYNGWTFSFNSPSMGGGIFMNLGEVGEATVMQRAGLWPPSRLEAVEFCSRCGRLILLMIHWCRQSITEMEGEKTRQTRLQEKQRVKYACLCTLTFGYNVKLGHSCTF